MFLDQMLRNNRYIKVGTPVQHAEALKAQVNLEEARRCLVAQDLKGLEETALQAVKEEMATMDKNSLVKHAVLYGLKLRTEVVNLDMKKQSVGILVQEMTKRHCKKRKAQWDKLTEDEKLVKINQWVRENPCLKDILENIEARYKEIIVLSKKEEAMKEALVRGV